MRIAGINASTASLSEAERLLGTDPSDSGRVAGVDVAPVRAGPDVITGQLLADTRAAARSGARIVLWSENAARVRSAAPTHRRRRRRRRRRGNSRSGARPRPRRGAPQANNGEAKR
jgi:hypothetical protein